MFVGQTRGLAWEIIAETRVK